MTGIFFWFRRVGGISVLLKMKEVVLTRPPYLNRSEQRIADMHSVLNILNILVGELSLVQSEDPDLMEQRARLDDELQDISCGVKECEDLEQLMRRIREAETSTIALMEAALKDEDAGTARKAEVEESLANLQSVFSILEKRLEELEMRAENPDVWIQIEPEVFRKQFEDVFLAIAKNSKGDYGIHFNLAQKEQGDYYIDLKIDVQPAGAQLWMPLRLLDILRDLTANARKYTPPGGKVALAIYQDKEHIRAVVEDSGCGIPDNEIEKVAEFGYRATNVRKRPTLGGGFGLTKAAWLVTSWGGRLTIKSEVDRGTTIRLSVPNTQIPDKPLNWNI